MRQKYKYVRFGVLIFVAFVVACIYGALSLVNSINAKYNNAQLQLALEKTSENEGFCLTEFVTEYNINYNNMADFYKDACVSIEVDADGEAWLGSGVCIASKGYETSDGLILESGSYIVTNHHVIEEYYSAYNHEVKVYPNDFTNIERYGTEIYYDAEILWSDSYIDMAIIYIEENIDWVKMKDRAIENDEQDQLCANEKVFVIGTPQSLSYQNTITRGIIASESLKYSYTVDEYYFTEVMSNIYEDVIAMQVSIMGGNSGGGLFDSKGYLIGQPTLGSTTSQSKYAINYSIPIYPAITVLDGIIKDNEAKEEIYIASIDDLDFKFIDSLESSIMTSYFYSSNLYFYGKSYKKSDLTFDESGLKVISSTNSLIDVNDVIEKVVYGKKLYEINDRNDLIYLLLNCKKGDKLGFHIRGEGIVQFVL